jgi:hypothetical protein
LEQNCLDLCIDNLENSFEQPQWAHFHASLPLCIAHRSRSAALEQATEQCRFARHFVKFSPSFRAIGALQRTQLTT